MTPIQQMYLGVGASKKTYLDDIFSTYVYQGTAGSNSVNNGINLSEEGGLVWFKERSGGANHQIFDTVRGATKQLRSDGTNAEETRSYGLTFNTNGYSLNSGDGNINGSSNTYASWTFRKAKGFFDIVTWTGNGNSNRQISHSLGSVPGLILVKCTSDARSWGVYHRGVGASKMLLLNNSDAATTNNGYWNSTTPTSTQFTVSTDNDVNGDTKTYVAYVFAHDDQSFGEGGDQSIIKCGSYTGNGAANESGPFINLGWEPQFLLIKNTSDAASWAMFDTIRGIRTGYKTQTLSANQNNAEGNYTNFATVTSTGFHAGYNDDYTNSSGDTYVYMAIRRPDGYVSKPVEDATKVFAMDTGNSSSTGPAFDSPFAVDYSILKQPAGALSWRAFSRFNEGRNLSPDLTQFEGDEENNTADYSDGIGKNYTDVWQAWMWKRHTGFDCLCFKGDGVSGRQISHSMNKTPQMIIIKNRTTNSKPWTGGHIGLNGGTTPWNYYIMFNSSDAEGSASTVWNNTAPTSTSFTLGNYDGVNGSGDSYLALLFSSVDKISKVGSYTGDGTSTTISLGFQPRFLLIRPTDVTEGWMILDTTRGWGSGNDQQLKLDEDSAQSPWNFGEPTSTGFTTDSNGFNINGRKYIYYAHA